jgi:hypothetical protein
MKRATVAALVGVIGGVAAIIGPALPWLSYSGSASRLDPSLAPPGLESASITGFTLDPFGVYIGIGLAVAAAWLWAGSEPRKALAFLGPISLAVATICVMVMVNKESALFGGFGGPGSELAFGSGVYVTLAGAVAGLAATAIAAWPEPKASDHEMSDEVEMVADRPTEVLPDGPG